MDGVWRVGLLIRTWPVWVSSRRGRYGAAPGGTQRSLAVTIVMSRAPPQCRTCLFPQLKAGLSRQARTGVRHRLCGLAHLVRRSPGRTTERALAPFQPPANGGSTSSSAPGASGVARSRTATESSRKLHAARTLASAAPCRCATRSTTSATVAPSWSSTSSAGTPAAARAPAK